MREGPGMRSVGTAAGLRARAIAVVKLSALAAGH